MLKKFLAGFLVTLVLLIILDAVLGLFRRPTVMVGQGGYGYDPSYSTHDHFWQDMFLYHVMFGGDHGWYGSGYYGHGFYPSSPVVVHQPTIIYHSPAPQVSRPSWGTTSHSWGSGTTSRTVGSGTTSRTFGGSAAVPSRPPSSWTSSSSPSRSSSSWGSSSAPSYSSGSSRSFGGSSSSFGSSSSSRSFGRR